MMFLRPQRFAPLLSLPLLAIAGAAIVACGLEAPRAAVAAPEPSPVPKRWELDVQPGPLRLTVVDLPGVGPRAYFFLTYKVTNNYTQDLLFAPAFEMATDAGGEPVRSGRDVPLAVTRAIMQKLDNSMLEDQITVVGNILRGSENAKESLAIWPAADLRVSELTIYGAGFSGETATLEVPNAEGKLEKKILRKTLRLRYRMPGELDPSSGGEYQPYDKNSIMR